MQFGQYSNIIQLAAALSMAGWVARTPNDAQEFPVDFNNQYTNAPNSRYHPYSNPPQNNWAENFNNQNYGPMVQQPVAPNNFPPHGRNELYQSKDAEESFRAYMELQELISWQESYRRGDLPLGRSNQQFVMPVVNNDDDKSHEKGITDDGYATGSSIGSPASSTISGIQSELDNISTASSPSPDSVFDSIESFNAHTPFSQISDLPQNNFDIDEILYDEKSTDLSPAGSPLLDVETEDKDQKVPFSKLISSLDDDLEYVDSPLKSPGADSFLASLSPEYNPPHTVTNNKYDPFQMQFTNSSLPNKFIADTLVDIGEFDPSFFESSGQTDEDMDKALVQSLSQKGAASAVTIKTEDDYSFVGSPLVEHDYSKEDFASMNHVTTKQSGPRFNDFARPNNNFIKRSSSSSSSSPSPRMTSRTFAPSSPKTQMKKKIQPKLKEQKQKQTLWSDFPYTTDQLINMPVERFNEVIKQLDEIRQHVAKDVRRKGKNKLAARNCRKRKMDVIDVLDDGIGSLEYQRQELLNQRQRIIEDTRKIQQKTEWLNNYIFEHLRDHNGIPYSTNDFSLQYTSDGNVYLVPSAQAKPTKV